MGRKPDRGQKNRDKMKMRKAMHRKRDLNREILEDICQYMHAKGITVHVNASATTNTFYLKFDYGALYSLRISNHHVAERKHNHRFNVITESVFLPPRDEKAMLNDESNTTSYFFSQYEIGELKRAIMDQYHAFLVRGDGFYESRREHLKKVFEEHRKNKTNAFAVRSTKYDPSDRKNRYLNGMERRF